MNKLNRRNFLKIPLQALGAKLAGDVLPPPEQPNLFGMPINKSGVSSKSVTWIESTNAHDEIALTCTSGAGVKSATIIKAYIIGANGVKVDIADNIENAFIFTRDMDKPLQISFRMGDDPRTERTYPMDGYLK